MGTALKKITRYGLICILIGHAGLWAQPRLKVSPTQVTAGTFQRISFTLDPNGVVLAKGGGIRIELPVAYLETGPYYWDTPQTDLPNGPGFITANAAGEARTAIDIYGHKDRIIQVTLLDNPENYKQKIWLQYAGQVQSLVWPLAIRAQYRENAEASWQDITPYPTISIQPQPAHTLLIITPADLQKNQPFEMAVVFIDRFGNQAIDYRGTLEFTATDPQADYPRNYSFTAEDSGRHVFSGVRFRTPGFQKISASDGKIQSKSHYCQVAKRAPQYKRYFGDTHYHTGTGTDHKSFSQRGAGGDHRGHFTSAEWAYHYARDVLGLDFASSAEHDAKKFKAELWEKSQDISDRYYTPGKFTTFYAYEWTAAPQVGHNVVIYKDREGKVLNHFDYPTKPALWEAFDQQDVPVIMIPHPMWAQPDHEMWNQVNNKYRIVGEIYSLWCTRFLLQPAVDVQRFETGINDPWSFQYAWARGHKIGVIGSSDNHTAHPGMNNYTTDMVQSSGLAVVLATENNRDAIWDALQNRRTYATTGTRILLRFSCDDHAMGSEYSTDNPPRIAGRVAGTNQLATVEIVKYAGGKYTVIYQTNPESDQVEFAFNDKKFSEDSMYYLRVKQVNERWQSPWAYPTAEMAWSSPIWVNIEK